MPTAHHHTTRRRDAARIKSRALRAGASFCAAVALALASACGPGADAEEPGEHGESYSRWLETIRAARPGGTWDEAARWDALPFVSIRLQRSGGYAFDSLDLEISGREARVRSNRPNWGWPSGATHVAALQFHDVARLNWLLETIELPVAPTEWSRAVFHYHDEVLTLTDRRGRTRTYRQYADAGPPTLGAVIRAIEAVGHRNLAWEPLESPH